MLLLFIYFNKKKSRTKKFESIFFLERIKNFKEVGNYEAMTKHILKINFREHPLGKDYL